MSDLRVREFERRWLAEGTYEAWNAWANALARAGDDVLVQVRERAKKWHSHHDRSIRLQIRYRQRAGDVDDDCIDQDDWLRYLQLVARLRPRDLCLLRAFCRAANRADRQDMAVEVATWLDLAEQHKDAEAISEAVAHSSWKYETSSARQRWREPLPGMDVYPSEPAVAAPALREVGDVLGSLVADLQASGHIASDGDEVPLPPLPASQTMHEAMQAMQDAVGTRPQFPPAEEMYQNMVGFYDSRPDHEQG